MYAIRSYYERQGDVSTRIAEAAYLERLCAKKLENQDVLFLWEA